MAVPPRGLDMGLPNLEKESNTLNASVFAKFGSLLSGYLHSFVFNSAQFSGENFFFSKMWRILVGEELTCRKLVVHFMLHYSRKTFSRKGFMNRNLFSCRRFLTTWPRVLLVCNDLNDAMTQHSLLLPLIANMLFVSMRKGWKRHFGGFAYLS